MARYIYTFNNLSTIAAVYSFVLAFPPRSPVIVLPSAMVCNNDLSQHAQVHSSKETLTVRAAFSIFVACSVRPMCRNIIKEDKRRAVGLARPLPRIAFRMSKKIPLYQAAKRTLNVWGRAMNGFENRGILEQVSQYRQPPYIEMVYPANVARRSQAKTTNETCTHVRQNVAVEVGHNHDTVSIRLWVLNNLNLL
jgi:hypothetical protein